MNRKSLLVVIIFLALLSLLMLSHQSEGGAVFGRYSVSYFIAIVLYFLGIITLILAWFQYDRVRVLLTKGTDRIFTFHFHDFIEKHSVIILLAIVVWNGVGALFYFPIQHVLSGQPILQVDYAFHYHQVAIFIQAMAQYGKHWAYDPSFMAGYPAGTLFDVATELFEMYVYGLTRLGISTSTAFNSFILVCYLTIPFILHAAAKCFGLSKTTSLLVVFTGVSFWLSYPLMVIFYTSGMIPFVYGIYVALLCAGLFYRFLVDQKLIHFCLFTAVLALSLMLHVLMPLLIGVPLGVLYITCFRKIKASSHALIFLSILAALTVNSWWIITVLRFRDYQIGTIGWPTLSISTFVRSFFDEAYTVHYILTVLGLWGFWVSHSKHKSLALMGLGSICWYFLIGQLGSHLPFVKTLEPGRFVLPASVFSMLGLALGAEKVLSQVSLSWVNLKKYAPILLITLMLSLSLFTPNYLMGNNHTKPGVVEEYQPLVEWITEHTTKDARIAFSDLSPGDYTGAKFRTFVDREIIGGLFWKTNLAHNFANFSLDAFINIEPGNLQLNDVMKYCRLYNIKWLVSGEESITNVMNAFSPFLTKVKEFNGLTTFTVYEVDIQPSFFISGTGSVSAALNTITVTNASSGEVVLGYHWLETFETQPKLPIEQVYVEDDPVPFIKVVNGDTRDFIIYNSYEVNIPEGEKSIVDRWGKYLDVFRMSYWNP